MTPAKLGWSLKDFFLYQDPGWPHNWLVMVVVSFIGLFGKFDIYMPETASKIYILFVAVGILGVLLMIREFYWHRRSVTVQKTSVNGEKVKIKTVRCSREWSKKGFFNLMMLASLVTPVILFIDYAYFNDNQAQGRYIMSAVYPVMYFVACGYGKLLERFVKNEKIRIWFYRISSGLWILGAVLVYLRVIIPAYAA